MTHVSQLELDGISVRVERKAIRNIHLAVYPPDGRVRISVPWRTTTDDVRAYLEGKRDWIVRSRQRMQSLPPAPFIPEGERRARWLELRAVLDELLPLWAERMQTGYSGYSVRLMKSRWGSCNVRTRRLCFNLLLAVCPRECVEYVVVHELCHTFVPNHGPQFKALMDRFLPDWRARRFRLHHRR